VFLDGFGPGVEFQAFGGSKLDALDIDVTVKYQGLRSMKFTVPSVGDPAGAFAGGAFTNEGGRNLTGYDALTFWAKASMVARIGVAGFGNDNTGTSRFVAQMTDLPVTTAWNKYVIPIPLSDKLEAEKGLFQLAAGAVDGAGYEVWFDEVQYERLGTIAQPRPAMATQTINVQVGDSANVEGTVVTFNVAGIDQTVQAAPGYFTFASSDSAVATVDADGLIRAVALGSATVTAKLGSVDATGAVTVNVGEAPPGPAEAAPTPTAPAGDVVSLFSNAYDDVTVGTWSAEWDDADVADVQIEGDDTKLYTNLVFAGIEFTSPTVDATAMTRFHMDIWTPDPTAAPAVFKVKLVDFGADGAFDGGDDVEHELTFDATTTPALATGSWVAIDVPLSDFTGLTTTGHLAQLILTGDPNTVYVDNVYFYTTGGGGGAPTVAAPTPTVPAGDVISLFSNAYSNATVDTWSAVWDNADVADVQIVGDDTKLYTNLVFAGIEFTSQTVDATAMTHFHMDIWTPDPTAAPAVFKVKLVDFGADDAFGGGDDVEHELTFDATTTPALATGSWVAIDVPLSDFTGLTTTGNLAQLILTGDPNTVYVDNVYFYTTGGGGGGTGVIDFEPGGLGASWTWSVFENVDNPPLQFVANPNPSGLNTSSTVAMFTARQAGQPFAGTITLDKETFTLDATNAIVRIMVYKSVISDVGIKFEQGAASTGEIKVANTLINQWEELTFDFSGVIGPINTNITGLIVFPDFQSGRTSDNIVYFDNISFNAVGGGGGGGAPTVAAPTPTVPAGDVISLFSNAYSNATVDTWSAEWDNADVADVQIVGDDTKLYTNLVFAGIEFTSQTVDATAMTRFHMDIWTPDPTAAPAVFKVKLVDFGADGAFGGGDDVEHELTFDATTTPALATGSWVAIDVPLSDFTGLTTTGHLAQLILSGDPNTVYVDNVYLHR